MTQNGAEMIIAERPSGTFSRQVFLGEALDSDKKSLRGFLVTYQLVEFLFSLGT